MKSRIFFYTFLMQFYFFIFTMLFCLVSMNCVLKLFLISEIFFSQNDLVPSLFIFNFTTLQKLNNVIFIHPFQILFFLAISIIKNIFFSNLLLIFSHFVCSVCFYIHLTISSIIQSCSFVYYMVKNSSFH